MLRDLLWTLSLRLDRRAARVRGGGIHPRETLILFCTAMWDAPPHGGGAALPPGFRVTTDRACYRDAAAVVFHIPTLGRGPLPPKLPGQVWIAWSMECDANYPRLLDAAFMRRFDLTMTYRLNADVVTAYTCFYGSGADVVRALRTPRRPGRRALAASFISSAFNRSGRLAYTEELMRYLDVHSYGRALRNRTLAQDRGRQTKLQVIADYAFTLAFENAIGEDYVTEKLYDPLVAGSVPVYLGAPNVETFAPGDGCFINVADFPRPRDLADYLLHLHESPTAYDAYFAWKERPLRSDFMRIVEGQSTPTEVRLCRAIQARREQAA